MFIAIDIGGTNTRIGASWSGRDFFVTEKFKTPPTFKEGLRTILKRIKWMQGDRKLHRVALAVPGRVPSRAEKSLLHFANLPGWGKNPLARMLSDALSTKVLLVNDADAAGLGEATRGAGRGHDIVAYLTLSTGVGGTRIHQGEIDGAAHGFSARGGCALGAEPGHQILVPNGRRWTCKQRGCFEAYASGTAFYKTYGVRAEFCRSKKIWARHAQIVGWGLINTIIHWSPDIVVIGGGLAQAGPLLFNPLRAYARTYLKIFTPPKIVPAKLGDQAGLYGCLELMLKN